MRIEKNNKRRASIYYQSRILESVFRRSGATRDAISRDTGFGASIVYSHTRKLQEKGIVRKSGSTDSGGGRRTDILSINPKAGRIIGAACLKTEIVLVMSDLAGEVLATEAASLAGKEKSSDIIDALLSAVKRIIDKPDNVSKQVLAVGVGVPGLVDPERRTAVANIHVDDWSEIPIRSIMETDLWLPVFIESNSHLTALAEKNFGKAKNSSDFLTLNVSNGVGMGVFMRNHLYSGHQGRAGEIGHFQMDPKGPLCSCGNRGCLEALVSIPAMLERAESAIAKGVGGVLAKTTPPSGSIDFSALCEAAEAKDKLALKIIRSAASILGAAIGNAINLLNPEMVIVNGEVKAAGPGFLSYIERAVDEVRSLPDTATRILYSDLPWPMAIARGGVALGLEKIFIDREIDILEHSQ